MPPLVAPQLMGQLETKWKRRIGAARSADYNGGPARNRVLASCVLELTPCVVRFVGEIEEDIEELFLLADEEPVVLETLNGSDGTAELSGSWANDGNGPKGRVEEVGWLGHDEVGLQRIAVERLGIRLSLGCGEGRKRDACPGSAGAIVRVGNRKSIAGLILPGLEMHGLARTDAEQDS